MKLTAVLPLIVTLALAAGLYGASFTYFKAQQLQGAQARLTLHRSTLQTELQHFAHLPFILSLDPVVMRTLAGGDAAPLDHRLARFAQSAGLDAIYLMTADGVTIASSNAKTPGSFKGQNYGFRPYFQAAQRGQLGQFYGIGATTGVPGYFYAMQVRVPQSEVTGVIAIKIDLSALQESWQASGERIILANADGVVLLASDPDWRYRAMRPLAPEQRKRITASRQFGSEPLRDLDWSLDPRGQTAEIGARRLLYLSTADLPNSWSLHFFVPGDEVVTRAWLVTGAFLALILLTYSGLQVNRLRRVRDALSKAEHEETTLRSINARLAIEIEERRTAEQQLQKTQAELERAGRLAALGQLASSVTHELGQPIAAMRNQLAAAEMTAGPSPLAEKMQSLVARMETITRQLKFFSRKGRDSFEDFDLASAMATALELLEADIVTREATLVFTKPDLPTLVCANRLRIEQVMTNILRNALDAIDGLDRRRIEVTLGSVKDAVWFEVADTGHGMQGKSLGDLQEPFATTRASGQGMGLGLTISAGVVADHGGRITATDGPQVGAIFRVVLPRNQTGSAP